MLTTPTFAFAHATRTHRAHVATGDLHTNSRASASARHGKVILAGGYGTLRMKHQFKGAKVRYASYGRLQCVPFARAASGIELKGNAANWWDAAAGVYERGQSPEPGSVLNFRSTGHMRLGHVAVVTAVRGEREIEIEHANWAGPGANKGGVSRDIPVVDVSPNNDWSQVRVGLGHSGDYGSVYPTYGFIYDRPDRGTMLARNQPAETATAGGDGQTRVVPVVDREVAQLPRRRGHGSHTRSIDDFDLSPSRTLR